MLRLGHRPLLKTKRLIKLPRKTSPSLSTFSSSFPSSSSSSSSPTKSRSLHEIIKEKEKEREHFEHCIIDYFQSFVESPKEKENIQDFFDKNRWNNAKLSELPLEAFDIGKLPDPMKTLGVFNLLIILRRYVQQLYFPLIYQCLYMMQIIKIHINIYQFCVIYATEIQVRVQFIKEKEEFDGDGDLKKFSDFEEKINNIIHNGICKLGLLQSKFHLLELMQFKLVEYLPDIFEDVLTFQQTISDFKNISKFHFRKILQKIDENYIFTEATARGIQKMQKLEKSQKSIHSFINAHHHNSRSLSLTKDKTSKKMLSIRKSIGGKGCHHRYRRHKGLFVPKRNYTKKVGGTNHFSLNKEEKKRKSNWCLSLFSIMFILAFGFIMGNDFEFSYGKVTYQSNKNNKLESTLTDTSYFKNIHSANMEYCLNNPIKENHSIITARKQKIEHEKDKKKLELLKKLEKDPKKIENTKYVTKEIARLNESIQKKTNELKQKEKEAKNFNTYGGLFANPYIKEVNEIKKSINVITQDLKSQEEKLVTLNNTTKEIDKLEEKIKNFNETENNNVLNDAQKKKNEFCENETADFLKPKNVLVLNKEIFQNSTGSEPTFFSKEWFEAVSIHYPNLLYHNFNPEKTEKFKKIGKSFFDTFQTFFSKESQSDSFRFHLAMVTDLSKLASSIQKGFEGRQIIELASHNGDCTTTTFEVSNAMCNIGSRNVRYIPISEIHSSTKIDSKKFVNLLAQGISLTAKVTDQIFDFVNFFKTNKEDKSSKTPEETSEEKAANDLYDNGWASWFSVNTYTNYISTVFEKAKDFATQEEEKAYNQMVLSNFNYNEIPNSEIEEIKKNTYQFENTVKFLELLIRELMRPKIENFSDEKSEEFRIYMLDRTKLLKKIQSVTQYLITFTEKNFQENLYYFKASEINEKKLVALDLAFFVDSLNYFLDVLIPAYDLSDLEFLQSNIGHKATKNLNIFYNNSNTEIINLLEKNFKEKETTAQISLNINFILKKQLDKDLERQKDDKGNSKKKQEEEYEKEKLEYVRYNDEFKRNLHHALIIRSRVKEYEVTVNDANLLKNKADGVDLKHNLAIFGKFSLIAIDTILKGVLGSVQAVLGVIIENIKEFFWTLAFGAFVLFLAYGGWAMIGTAIAGIGSSSTVLLSGVAASSNVINSVNNKGPSGNSFVNWLLQKQNSNQPPPAPPSRSFEPASKLTSDSSAKYRGSDRGLGTAKQIIEKSLKEYIHRNHKY